jgi:hypothetical protein
VTTEPIKPVPDKPKKLDVNLLPDVTRDEEGGFESRDDFLRGEVPPHHGG